MQVLHAGHCDAFLEQIPRAQAYVQTKWTSRSSITSIIFLPVRAHFSGSAERGFGEIDQGLEGQRGAWAGPNFLTDAH